jgi:acyl-coenzyme A thioesterase PaaI-like protein
LSRAAIRARVLRALALNRQPGFHFPGNFLDISFDRVATGRSLLSFQPGPWCNGPDGQVDFGSLAVLADLALAACMRARLGRATRLATVSMSLQFTGAPRTGRLKATGEFQGFFEKGAGRLGMSRVSITGGKGQVCYGTGSFMALEPPAGVVLHPVPLRNHRSPEPARLRESELLPDEKLVLKTAAKALKGKNFIDSFWGGRNGVLRNGPHAGNRVGHAQGGILVGVAANAAGAALPHGWRLAGLTALYISPGAGKALRADTGVLHQGRLTAVVRTDVSGAKRRVLEVISTHSASA